MTHEARALAYIDAFNSRDPKIYETYMQQHRVASVLAQSNPEDRGASYAQIQEMFGEMAVIGVNLPSENEAWILVETVTDLPVRIIFTFEPGADGKVIDIRFEPGGPVIEIDPNWTDLGDLLTAYVAQSGVPAWAVAVVKDGKIIEHAAIGVLSAAGDTPVDAATSKFHWGSVTKSVTGTLIGALIEEGVLDWNATIGDVFSQHDILPAYKNVTISQLMAHRAGIPPYEDFDDAFIPALEERFPGSFIDQRQGWALEILKNDAPIFTPGAGSRYSNAGITIAGVMAELATGQSWEELVKSHVFIPAGMADAGFGWPASASTPHQTRGHFGSGPDNLEVAPLDAMSDLLAVSAPAGNVHSTIGNFARYAALHMNGIAGRDAYLDAQTIQRLHTPLREEMKSPGPYSFGWGQSMLANGETMHWHNGGAGTFYAEIRLIPESNVAIVIMANAGFAEAAIRPLWSALFERYVE